jgi:hypothetical protein
MKRDTLIEHKETIVLCEENGLINLSFNVLLTTQEANIVAKLVILVAITKLALTCSNCGKTCHTFETCHNIKKDVIIILIVVIKSDAPPNSLKDSNMSSKVKHWKKNELGYAP